jgi:hypothetical protein
MQNDIEIFREIKSEIQINPENFKPAGQWLDGLFPNISGFIKPMSKAFTKAACEYPLDCRKIMLIAWLVTDKYLSESKLGITKYEQYVFNHEVRKPRHTGLPFCSTEQEQAKEAVFARPDAMDTIRDAYLSYKGTLSGESIGTKAVKVTDLTDTGQNSSKVGENAGSNIPDMEETAKIEKGNNWVFNFNDETVSVDGKLKGLKLLEFLLTHPNEKYNPLELLKKAGLESQGSTASELVYESKDRRLINKDMENLQAAYDIEPDPAKKAQLKEQIDKANEMMGKATNKFGKSRNISDKYRLKVDRLIRKIFEKIAIDSPKLHNHLKAFLKFPSQNSYKPDKNIVWDIK